MNPDFAIGKCAADSEMNIILAGFMGTGKSTIGKRVAEMLERPFVDMDVLIESRAGKPIPRIFKEDGEPRFRDMERGVVRELAEKRGMVIAAGGGVVLNPENISDFSRSGLIVCLSAPQEELLRRMTASKGRPLLEDGSMAERIASLLKVRKPLYDAIPCRIDTGGLSVDEAAERIVRIFKGLDSSSNFP